MIQLVKRLILNYMKNKRQRQIFKLLDSTDFNRIYNVAPRQVKTVAFVLPRLAAYSGGTTSILRLGSYLNQHGYDVTYVSLAPQSTEEMTRNALINLKSCSGTFVTFQEEQTFDIVIATSWETVYSVKMMNGYKMYFVQDYEPLFCNNGEQYILAQKTYDLGLHMVSLGFWNQQMIKKNTRHPIQIDSIEFPYEKSEYHYIKRNYTSYKTKKVIKLAVYLKDAERRLPSIMQYILLDAKERFQKDGISLEISFYGGISKIIPDLGKNLGKLSKTELEQLYTESDFGMVASMTNISLVPYEMLATGLPLIEFSDGSYYDFLGEDSATLIELSGQDLYAKIKALLSNPTELEAKNRAAQNRLAQLSWNNTGKQFAAIIENLVKTDEN